MNPEPRLVEVRKNVLKQNDMVARALRERFRGRRFRREPGFQSRLGEDRLSRKDADVAAPDYRVAALVGDLATENDAVRLARSQAPVKQITTGTLCHLEAAMVRKRWKKRNGILTTGLPVHRKCRQPGLSILLRSGRRSAAGADLGDRGRRQASEISHDFQQR